MKPRCHWCTSDPIYIDYHDHEWGVPLHDDQKLFEMLILEGMQAGLNWITILKKRENFREAFNQFDAEKIVRYSKARIEKLLQNSGIIRNRLKIEAVLKNARGYLEIKEKEGFDQYIWQFTQGRVLSNHWKESRQIPTSTSISDAMSKDLKQRGFSFVGTTICYAYMQAVGLVNDHLVTCFRYRQ